jgi:hypothetical protein
LGGVERSLRPIIAPALWNLDTSPSLENDFTVENGYIDFRVLDFHRVDLKNIL